MHITKDAFAGPWAHLQRTGTNGRVQPKKVSSPVWEYSAREQLTEVRECAISAKPIVGRETASMGWAQIRHTGGYGRHRQGKTATGSCNASAKGLLSKSGCMSYCKERWKTITHQRRTEWQKWLKH